MNYFDLKQEIEVDPENMGYKNEDGTRKSSQEIFTIINTPNDKFKKQREDGKIPLDQLLTFSGAGLWDRMVKLSTNQNLVSELSITEDQASTLRSIACVFLKMFDLPSIQNFALNLPSNVTLVQTLMSVGLLSQEEVDTLTALSYYSVSRATLLYGVDATIEDIDRSN